MKHGAVIGSMHTPLSHHFRCFAAVLQVARKTSAGGGHMLLCADGNQQRQRSGGCLMVDICLAEAIAILGY